VELQHHRENSMQMGRRGMKTDFDA